MSTRLFFLFLIASRLYAAFTFTNTPNAVDIYHYGAKVLVSTSAVTNARVVWDVASHTCSAPCAAYPNSDTDGAAHGAHTWFVGAAPANTVIFWRWCANDGSGEVCDAEQSFTTLPLPNPHPALATLPQTTPVVAVPTQAGTSRTVGLTSGCGTLLACWNISSCGDTIVLPSATPQQATFALPAKTCSPSNWLLIKTDQANLLPPVGVRIDKSYLPVLASVENSSMFHYATPGYGGSQTLDNGHCWPGAYFWNAPIPSANTPGWYMNQCVQNATTHAITGITGCTGAGNGNLGNCSVTTSNAHGFSTANGGDIVYVSGVAGIARANGTCRVTAITSSTVFVMTCAAAYTDASNSYVSGGTVANHLWQSVPFTPVSLGSLPTSCSVQGSWGYDSTNATEDFDPSLGPAIGTTSTGSVVRCVRNESGTANGWRTWEVWLRDPVNGNPVFAVDLSGSSYIYLLGIRFSRVSVPPEPLFLRDGGPPEGVTSFQGGKVGQGYVRTSLTSSNIVMDRCLFDGLDYPNGMVSGAIVLHGDGIAMVESYVSGIGYWFGSQDHGPRYDNFAAAAIFRSGGNGFLQRNNYIEAYGISTHHDDSYADFVLNQNITTVRNSFFRNPTHFFGATANAAAYPSGVYWPVRQLYEHKQGEQVLVDGNTFTNNWRNVSQGAAIALTPRMEASAGGPNSFVTASSNTLTWTNLASTGLSTNSWIVCTVSGLEQLFQVTGTPTANSATVASIANGSYTCSPAVWAGGDVDQTFTNNTISSVPNAINVFGIVNPDGGTTPFVLPTPLRRITRQNNLYVDIIDDGTRQDPNVWQSSGGGYGFFALARYTSDAVSTHETVYQLGGTAGTVTGAVTTNVGGLLRSSEGIQITNDIYSMATSCVGACASNSPINGNGVSGSALMTAAYINSTLGGGLFQMTGGDPGGYPASIHFLNGTAAYKFADPARQDFRLRFDSPGISGASPVVSGDGLDAGAAIDMLEAAQGKVSNVRVRSITATSAIVSFFAPDTVGCTVDWSTSATFTPGSLTRVGNSGGARTQDVTLTGLTTQTQYFYRVNCQVQQPTGSFQTR